MRTMLKTPVTFVFRRYHFVKDSDEHRNHWPTGLMEGAPPSKAELVQKLVLRRTGDCVRMLYDLGDTLSVRTPEYS